MFIFPKEKEIFYLKYVYSLSKSVITNKRNRIQHFKELVLYCILPVFLIATVVGLFVAFPQFILPFILVVPFLELGFALSFK
ncbi:UNVERIFIED_CONTAM: hypothetical protein ABIC26_002704 [Paenibacillus sp. PvR008]